MTAVADVARYADPAFSDHVERYGADRQVALEQFFDLDELDQALVVLFVARFAPGLYGAALKNVNEAPCFSAGCGHPRHIGGCDQCECAS